VSQAVLYAAGCAVRRRLCCTPQAVLYAAGCVVRRRLCCMPQAVLFVTGCVVCRRLCCLSRAVLYVAGCALCCRLCCVLLFGLCLLLVSGCRTWHEGSRGWARLTDRKPQRHPAPQPTPPDHGKHKTVCSLSMLCKNVYAFHTKDIIKRY